MNSPSKQTRLRRPLIVIMIVIVLTAIIILRVWAVFVLQAPFMGTSKTNRKIGSSTIPIKEKWVYDTDRSIAGNPVIAENRIIVRTESEIIAIDSEKGKQVWQVNARTHEHPPTRPTYGHNTIVYFESSEEIKALSLSDGQTKWAWHAPLFGGYIDSVQITEDIVYVSLSRGCSPLIALSRELGSLLWQTGSLESKECDGGTLTLRSEGLYLVSGPDLYLLDPKNGKVLRSVIGKYMGGGYQPLLGDNLYWTTGGSVLKPGLPTLVAQDIYRGGIRWKYDGHCKPMDNNPLFPNLIEGRIIAGGGCHALFSFAPESGKLLWNSEIPANAERAIVQIDNLGYVLLENASIIAFDLDSGEIRGRLETSPATTFFTAPGIASDGKSLYANFGDNRLYAFGK